MYYMYLMRRALGCCLTLCIACTAQCGTAQCDTMASERRVPFVLFGVGGVGAELLKVILESRPLHSRLYGLRFTAVGVADSSGALLSKPSASGELSDATLQAVIQHKAEGVGAEAESACHSVLSCCVCLLSRLCQAKSCLNLMWQQLWPTQRRPWRYAPRADPFVIVCCKQS